MIDGIANPSEPAYWSDCPHSLSPTSVRYQITHTTTYHYDRPVTLAPHTLRLRPRCNGQQKLHQFSLELEPQPKQLSENVDLDGNSLIKAWFDDQPISQFTLKAVSNVETLCTNPFVYLLEPWAVSLPMDYPSSLLSRLQPYLSGQFSPPTGAIDPEAMMLAQEIWQETHGNTTSFLTVLNQRIYTRCRYLLRETGSPLPPGVTWRTQQGSCRDYAVLFVEVCRAVGIAARFVSGYQEGDPDSTDRHLHAWAEAYLPGAGWRGYDPTHGLVVSDRHIALVSSALASDTAPVSGHLKTGGANAEMTYELWIQIAG
ncbi:MAG TPA: transglutaminase family protein [Coleofasciculaceae cyanobacterium]